LWLINAFAVALQTLPGTAGEALGFDRLLKSNTTRRRTQLAAAARQHALATHPNHAGTPTSAAGQKIRRIAEGTPGVHQDVQCYLKMRGFLLFCTAANEGTDLMCMNSAAPGSACPGETGMVRGTAASRHEAVRVWRGEVRTFS
jgi:hypothetical protein